MARRWTPHTLRTHLLACLRRRDFHLGVRKIRSSSAFIEYAQGGPAHIVADPMQVSLINAVVHETIHYVLDAEMKPFLGIKLMERAYDAWEELIAKQIINSPKEYERWCRAIERKLKEED